MIEALQWIGSLGAALVSLTLMTAIAVAAAWLGMKVANRRRSSWQGWAVGLLAFLLIGLVFYPAIEALREVECRSSSDYRACIENE